MQRSGFSLASVFVLVAVAAVFLAAIQMALAAERFSGVAWAMVAGVGPLVGLVVGILIGVTHVRCAGWGAFFGALAGLIAGALAGVLMVVPESVGAVAVGSTVIIAFTLVVRRLSGRRS